MEYVNKAIAIAANTWFGLMTPLRSLVEREGTAPNMDMRATKIVMRVLGVGRAQD